MIIILKCSRAKSRYRFCYITNTIVGASWLSFEMSFKLMRWYMLLKGERPIFCAVRWVLSSEYLHWELLFFSSSWLAWLSLCYDSSVIFLKSLDLSFISYMHLPPFPLIHLSTLVKLKFHLCPFLQLLLLEIGWSYGLCNTRLLNFLLLLWLSHRKCLLDYGLPIQWLVMLTNCHLLQTCWLPRVLLLLPLIVVIIWLLNIWE